MREREREGEREAPAGGACPSRGFRREREFRRERVQERERGASTTLVKAEDRWVGCRKVRLVRMETNMRGGGDAPA